MRLPFVIRVHPPPRLWRNCVNSILFLMTPRFERERSEYLDEDQFTKLTDALRSDPTLGDVIPGTGGFRKMRWAREGIGKRGGLRIIYYFVVNPRTCVLLSVFSKSDKPDLTSEDRRLLKRTVERIREELANE